MSLTHTTTYGRAISLLWRSAAEADSMLEKEKGMLALPGSPLSIDLLDARRKKR